MCLSIGGIRLLIYNVMKLVPTLSDTVIYYPNAADTEALTNQNNVDKGVAAIVTRDWGAGTFNLTVFPDHGIPIFYSLVPQRGFVGETGVWDVRVME